MSPPLTLPSHVRLVDVVGRGGSATVWRARDRRSGRDLAVKVVPIRRSGAHGDVDTAFDRELRALARLSGLPNVLEVVSAGVEDRVAWIVTPLAETSLWERTARSGPLDGEAIADIAVRLAGALAGAHDRGVVHGDVTPSNVLLLDDEPVLADFGLAVVQAAAGPDPRVGATPGWAAPERLDGATPTVASDVYGLGATLWSAATGARPPAYRPPDPERVQRGLRAIVSACCRIEPRLRPSAAEVARGAESELRRRRRYCPDP